MQTSFKSQEQVVNWLASTDLASLGVALEKENQGTLVQVILAPYAFAAVDLGRVTHLARLAGLSVSVIVNGNEIVGAAFQVKHTDWPDFDGFIIQAPIGIRTINVCTRH
jgi:hypothetical protein